jgi:hypothetical protein
LWGFRENLNTERSYGDIVSPLAKRPPSFLIQANRAEHPYGKPENRTLHITGARRVEMCDCHNRPHPRNAKQELLQLGDGYHGGIPQYITLLSGNL